MIGQSTTYVFPELPQLDEPLPDEDGRHQGHLLGGLLPTPHDRLILVVLELEAEYLGGDR